MASSWLHCRQDKTRDVDTVEQFDPSLDIGCRAVSHSDQLEAVPPLLKKQLEAAWSHKVTSLKFEFIKWQLCYFVLLAHFPTTWSGGKPWVVCRCHDGVRTSKSIWKHCRMPRVTAIFEILGLQIRGYVWSLSFATNVTCWGKIFVPRVPSTCSAHPHVLPPRCSCSQSSRGHLHRWRVLSQHFMAGSWLMHWHKWRQAAVSTTCFHTGHELDWNK